jgi:hypothetical protein
MTLAESIRAKILSGALPAAKFDRTWYGRGQREPCSTCGFRVTTNQIVTSPATTAALPVRARGPDVHCKTSHGGSAAAGSGGSPRANGHDDAPAAQARTRGAETGASTADGATVVLEHQDGRRITRQRGDALPFGPQCPVAQLCATPVTVSIFRY